MRVMILDSDSNVRSCACMMLRFEQLHVVVLGITWQAYGPHKMLSKMTRVVVKWFQDGAKTVSVSAMSANLGFP